MIMTGISDLFCLICDVAIDNSSCVNICSSLLYDGEPLANFVLRVLRPATLEFQSSYICLPCYNLFQTLENAQYTIANIRCEILNVYRKSIKQRAFKKMLQNEEHLEGSSNNITENLNEQNKIIADNVINSTKLLSTLSQNPINNEIGIASQTFLQDATLSRDTDIDTIMDINTTKVIKNTNMKKKDVICLNNEENVSCCVAMNDPKSFNSTTAIINNDITKAEEYFKSLDFNMLDHSLDNSMDEKRDHNISDDNSVKQKNIFYTQQSKRIKLFKTHNGLHINVLKHENSEEYYDSENKIKFSSKSKNDTANSCTNTIAKINIKNSVLPQCNQKQSNKNIVEIDIDTEYITEREVNDCTTNQNIPVESNRLPILHNSKNISGDNSSHAEYSCTICGKKWKTSAELKMHIKTHSTLKPYMCEKCGQVYKHKHALKVHIGMHNGINPFQCSYCKKCFTQKGALMRHLPMHTGETPYQCELCGKRFIHHTSYNMHTLSHTGKKSYQCNVCSMFLLSTSHLKRHMRVHTGEKPYSCNLCGKRFAERYNLYAHHKIHDPDEITMREKKKNNKRCKEYDKEQELDVHLKCYDNSSKNKDKKLINYIFNTDRDSAEVLDNYALHIRTPDVNMKKSNLQNDAIQQTWMKSNENLHNMNDQMKFVLLKNSSQPDIDTDSLVAFNDQNFSLENINFVTQIEK